MKVWCQVRRPAAVTDRILKNLFPKRFGGRCNLPVHFKSQINCPHLLNGGNSDPVECQCMTSGSSMSLWAIKTEHPLLQIC